MRRRPARVLALVLAVGLGALGACGDDDDGSTATTTTAAPSTVTTTAADPAAAVDAFCAKTEELQALVQQMAGRGEDQPPTSAEQAQLQAIGSEAAQMMMTLQGSVAQMLPGDAARFQECAAMLGGGAPAG